MLISKEYNMSLAEERTNITDITLNLSTKKPFRINGDDNMIIELDTSDLNVITRYEEGYKNLLSEIDKVVELADDEDMENISSTLKQIDKQMRDYVDFIFDSKVSDVCVVSGTMYDMYGSKYRFEHILDTLLSLYTDNVQSESKKIKARIQKHTDKYTSKRSATKPKRRK